MEILAAGAAKPAKPFAREILYLTCLPGPLGLSFLGQSWSAKIHLALGIKGASTHFQALAGKL